MTPKEKAEQLVNKFILYTEKYIDGWIESDLQAAKSSALIVVDEILNHHSQEQGLYRIDTYFWKQVKKELQNLK